MGENRPLLKLIYLVWELIGIWAGKLPTCKNALIGGLGKFYAQGGAGICSGLSQARQTNHGSMIDRACTWFVWFWPKTDSTAVILIFWGVRLVSLNALRLSCHRLLFHTKYRLEAPPG